MQCHGWPPINTPSPYVLIMSNLVVLCQGCGHKYRRTSKIGECWNSILLVWEGWLTPRYTPIPMWYHVKFGSSASCINRREPQKLQSAGTPPPWGGAWLSNWKQAPPHMCYHVKIGSSASTDVCRNRREHPKLGSSCMADPLEIHLSPMCDMWPNLVILGHKPKNLKPVKNLVFPVLGGSAVPCVGVRHHACPCVGVRASCSHKMVEVRCHASSCHAVINGGSWAVEVGFKI